MPFSMHSLPNLLPRKVGRLFLKMALADQWRRSIHLRWISHLATGVNPVPQLKSNLTLCFEVSTDLVFVPEIYSPTLTTMSDSGTTAFVLSSGVLLLITLLVSLRMRSKDPYGLFHLTLNKLPSQDPKLPPATEWLNMGYWKVGYCWFGIVLEPFHL